MKKYYVWCLVNLLCVPSMADTMAQSMTAQQLIQSGREAFLNRCSGCHGIEADGNGPAAVMLNPKPRNLVSGTFKFRTTPSGILPTIKDLIRTIERGVPGSAMPPFAELGDKEKLSLALYIRSLRAEFKDTLADQVSITIPTPPKENFSTKAGLLAAAKRGQKFFQSFCISCHGESGRGDGPSAADLTDSDNQPIRPANLRLPHLKGGNTARDIYRTVNTGLDGSPMPSFDSLLKPQDSWDVASYIFYLRGLEAGIYTEKDTLQ